MLYYWDLIVESHAAVVALDIVPDSETVAVRQLPIDHGAGGDDDFRHYDVPDTAFTQVVSWPSQAEAWQKIGESINAPNPPLACDVASLEEAKDAILTAMHARGGIEVNCDGMTPAVFQFVRKVIESLEGNPMHASYTLKLFTEPPPATTPIPQTPSSTTQPFATPGLADW